MTHSLTIEINEIETDVVVDFTCRFSEVEIDIITDAATGDAICPDLLGETCKDSLYYQLEEFAASQEYIPLEN